MTDKPEALEEMTLTVTLKGAALKALMEVARRYAAARKAAGVDDIVQAAIKEYLEAHRGDLPAELQPVEEVTDDLNPAERAELTGLLSEYMADGRLDLAKVKADPRYAKFASRIDPEQIYFWTPEWQAKEREADADIAAGNWEEFDNIDDVFKV